MKTPFSILFFLTVLCVTIITPVLAAPQISVSPTVVQRGGQITISMQDIPDNSYFSLLIEGEFVVKPNDLFVFDTTNFNMPFSLQNGQLSATIEKTQRAQLSVSKGGETFSYIKRADSNGIATVSRSDTISSGLYDSLKLEGKARSDTTTVITSLNLAGIKKGLQNSQITFNIEGIDNGIVQLIIYLDNSQVLYQRVTVGNGLPTPTATQTSSPTTTATTAVPTTTATTVVTTTAPINETVTPVNETVTTGTNPSATETTRVPGTNPTPTASATAVPGKAFYSADRKVSLQTQGIDYAALMMVSAAEVPDTWLMVSKAYTIAPDSLTFSPHATISFAIPESGNDYAYFIGRRVTNDWAAVSSTAGTGTIEGKVDLVGTYALMAFRPESTIKSESTVGPAVTGTAEAATPTPLVTVAAKPKIASIAQSSPAAAPTRASIDIVVVTGALAIFVAIGYHARHRRK